MDHLDWVTDELLEKLGDLQKKIGRCPGSPTTARVLGITKGKAERLVHWWKDQQGVDPTSKGWNGIDVPSDGDDGPVKVSSDPPKKTYTVEEGDTTAIASGKVEAESRIMSLDALLEAAEVDGDIWWVTKWIANRWEMPAGEGTKHPMWQVKAWLERRVPKLISDATDPLIERMAAHAPKYPKIRRRKVTDPHMLEISLVDHHFGKLAWRREAGEDYDLRIAEDVWRSAVDDILDKVAGYPIDKVLLPLGHDFFNFDDPRGETPKGTPQDNDSRPVKVFRAGCAAAVHAVDLLLEIADVEVVFVPGNHDPNMSYYMVERLEAWYRNCSHVSFNIDPIARKYIRYGRSLIGLTHGDMTVEGRKTLPTIMATEAKPDWADTDFHEWHLGHWHKRSETRTLPLDSFGGVPVRVLPSLCGTDKWHYEQGYVGNKKATDAFLWSKAHGLTGYFTSYAKTEA